MKTTLTPGTEALVRQEVADARYASAAEVVEAARLLDTENRYEYLRSQVREAEQDIRNGRLSSGCRNFIANGSAKRMSERTRGASAAHGRQ